LKDPEKKGDLFVRIKVRVPRSLTPEQKTLLAQVRALQVENRSIYYGEHREQEHPFIITITVLLLASLACQAVALPFGKATQPSVSTLP